MGGVFISYRREDAAGFAGRIYDRLTNSLGRDSVFIDVDNIPAGLDFVDVLSERVGRCDALVAIIGRNWLGSADKNNRRRLEDANDFVRIEIEAALTRKVPVIPVLVDGAVMPQADDLPDGLKKLARRQGIEISHTRFDSDAERLTDALARIEEAARQGGEQDMRLPSRRDKTFATAASPGHNGDTGGGDGAPSLVWARSNVLTLALASGAVAIIVAFGAWFLTRSSTEALRPTANLELPSAPASAPRPAAADATANAATRQSIGDPAVLVGPAGKLLGDASSANAAAPSSNKDLAREIEQQKGALANASKDIDRLSKEANDAIENMKTGGDPLAGAKSANAAARRPNPTPDPSLTGKIADSAPAGAANAARPDAALVSQQWMYAEDFAREYYQRIAQSYPDDFEARCDNNVPQRRAHWSPRPAGQHFQLNRSVEGHSFDPNEKDFEADSADMTAKGFTIKKDYPFAGCDGSKQHLTLWVKG